MSAAPPRTATSLPQNGGNGVIRAATRRQPVPHAANPRAGQIGNQRRAYSPRLVPNCGTRGAAAGPGRASKRRRSPTNTPGTAGVEGIARPAEPGRGAGGRRQGQVGLRDRPLRAAGSRVAISRAGRRPPAHTAPQRHEAATGFPATASSRSVSAAQNDGTAQVDATQQSGTASDQAVMSTWSSTAARPASRRATGTRNGEQDT